MNEKKRIYPFIKDLHGGKGICPDVENMAGSGIPETNRMVYGGTYPYPYLYPYPYPYAVCLGDSMIPDVQFSGIPFPYPSVVCGSSEYQIKTKIVRVDNEGKETEILFDSDKNNRSENIIGQKQETKKQPGKSTEEICKRFTEMLLFLIQENEIAVSVGKDCDEKEWDISYGYEENGYIYLNPQETYSFVAKRIQETDGAEGIPTSRQLQHYLYQVNILEKGDGKNYTKKKTIKKKRGRYWCLKKKEMSEFVRRHEEKDLDIILDMKKLKI